MKSEIDSYEAQMKLLELLRQVRTGKSFAMASMTKVIDHDPLAGGLWNQFKLITAEP